MKDRSREAYSIADLREIALQRVPKGMFEFVDRGTGDEFGSGQRRKEVR